MANGLTGVQFTFRPYQTEALREIWKAWMEHKHVLAQLPTGTGKTILFSGMTNHVVKNLNKNVLILAHREELISQAGDKLQRSTGIDSAREKAQETGHDSFHNVVVGSVQTLCRDNRLQRYSPNHFDYIIVDETHRILAKTYQKILNYFSSAKVLGVTATAMRGDRQNLGKFFDTVAYEYSLKQAIDDGWLSPIRARTCPLDIDISQCTVSAGDYQLGDLGAIITPYLEEVADEMVKYCMDRKTLLFLPLIETSKLMSDILTAKGIECRHVDGSFAKTNRSDAVDWFRNAPRGTALCNSMLLTEGYDQEDIDCVVVLRPTKSTGLYAQMVGRGTRVLDQSINEEGLSADERRSIIAKSDKPNLLLLDFLWNTARHRLCTPASLVAKNDEMLDKMEEALRHEGEQDLESVEDSAAQSIANDREASLARLLESSKGRRALEIDPVVQALSVFNNDIVNYEPEMQWESQPISGGQKEYLENNGFDCAAWNRGFASQVIDTMIKRNQAGLCTPKQMRTLQKHGYKDAHKMTREEAGKAMDELFKKWDNAKKWRKHI